MSMDILMVHVMRFFGVSFEELHGTGRRKAVVDARGMISVLARDHTAFSYPEIARAMNRPSHTTIIAAEGRMRAILADENAQLMGVPAMDARNKLADQFRADVEREIKYRRGLR